MPTTMRFNHMELTFPRGGLDEKTRADIRSFYCDGFGWRWVDFPLEDQVAPMLVPDLGQFLLLVETDEPMHSPGLAHLGLLVDTKEQVEEIAAFCQDFRKKDDRVELRYVGETLRMKHADVHFFYVRYLLPIFFDVSAYLYKPGFEPPVEWRFVSRV